jgi:hypothetical protein
MAYSIEDTGESDGLAVITRDYANRPKQAIIKNEV